MVAATQKHSIAKQEASQGMKQTPTTAGPKRKNTRRFSSSDNRSPMPLQPVSHLAAIVDSRPRSPAPPWHPKRLSPYPPTTILCSSPAGTDALRHLRAVASPHIVNTAHEPPVAITPCVAVIQSPYGRSAASGLPCAGAAPPQRPPPKPSLTRRAPSSQRVGLPA